MRLNKFLAHSGYCSRRKADEFIKNGQITINGSIITNFSTLVSENDQIKINGKLLKPERKKVYILLNKPRNTISTNNDEKNRKTVIDLLKPKVKERIYPIGRLDRDTTGVLLLTNDGTLSQQLTHPKFLINKVYRVKVNKTIDLFHFEELKNGILLEDGLLKPDHIRLLKSSKERKELIIKLHSGKNHIIKRLMAYFNYNVVKLDRISFGNILYNHLKKGEWRFLTNEEIKELKDLPLKMNKI